MSQDAMAVKYLTLRVYGMHGFKIRVQGNETLQSSWTTGTIITHSYSCIHTPGMLKAASAFSSVDIGAATNFHLGC
ncbi:hypothetical protein TSUD_197430 [Trifolium subterraneum]|uniref:Uncharacterized protein n=1 Tax=Trifolium subterraneum TaxID=3900 RepID=A0A2Z6M203_TRISU|nr:hypothetical protein TSUD_197430 [Trifolium subterraneum]